jgi:hypothetical protein
MRDRKEPEILEVNENSLFNDKMDVTEESEELETIHPSIVEQDEEPALIPAVIEAKPIVDNVISEDETEIVDSYLNLPGGGEYHVTDGITVYQHPDGSRWQQEEGGKFHRLA